MAGYDSGFEFADPGLSNPLTLSPDMQNVVAAGQFYPSSDDSDTYARQRAAYNPLTPSFSRATASAAIPAATTSNALQPTATASSAPVSTTSEPPPYPPWGGPPPWIKDASGKLVDNPEYINQAPTGQPRIVNGWVAGEGGKWVRLPQQASAEPATDTTTNDLQPKPSATPAPVPQPTRFDLAGGDSISVMQYTHRVNPKMSNNRIWGVEGPQYNANNPAPFTPWETGAVGDPPNRIRDRYKYLLQQNPHYFDNINNMYLTIGSNDPSQLDATKELLSMLRQANPNMHVVVPGMGPGVQDSAVMNKALQNVVEGAGYTFFQPKIRWASDGVHPANSGEMFDQANTALSAAKPSPPPTAGSGLATGLPTPTSPPVNPLAPPQPAAGPVYNQYDLVRHFEAPGDTGLSQSLDEGSPSIGYGHTITKQELSQGYIAGPAGERIPLDRITPEQKELIFQADIPRYIADIKKNLPEFDSLNRNQQEALFSYYYNTGHLPKGATSENVKAGNFQAVADSIRAGPYTGVQSGYLPGLEARRNAEADQFLLPEGQYPTVGAEKHYGYSPGQRVPGTGYAVGRPVSDQIPQPGSQTYPPYNPLTPRPGEAGTPTADAAQEQFKKIRDAQTNADQLKRMALLNQIAQALKGSPVNAKNLMSGLDPGKLRQEFEYKPPPYSAEVGAPPEIKPARGVQPLQHHELRVEPVGRPAQAQLLQKGRGSSIPGI